VKLVIRRDSASSTVSGVTLKVTGLASIPVCFAMKTGMKVISGGSMAWKFSCDSSNSVPVPNSVMLLLSQHVSVYSLS
jgi:hypothetical protein